MQAAAGRLAPPTSFAGLLALGTVGAGLLAGILIAGRGAPGLAFALGLVYVPIAMFRLPLAIALWVPLVVLSRVPGVGLGATTAMVILLIGWLGLLANAGADRSIHLRGRALAISLTLAISLWVLLSLAWAMDTGLAAAALVNWLTAALTLVLIATSIVRVGDARLVAAAFVVGMVISVAIGLVSPGVTSDSAIALASESENGRFSGASGDPNYLAAGIVPALALIAGLVQRRRPLENLALGGAAIVLVFSLAATQSRGGLLAAAIAVITALIVFRGRRSYVVIAVLAMLATAALWFAMNPSGLERVTQSDKGGTGRTELWGIGVRMAEDHPIAGVGIENFVNHSREYVRRPGSLEFVAFTEQPYVPHNVFIGLVAELGIVGLALYLALVAAALASALRAARLFEAVGERAGATLAQATVVAIVGTEIASIFISNPTDGRTWILLGLGPALLATARLSASRVAVRTDHPHHGGIRSVTS